jgi:hypothetical protein
MDIGKITAEASAKYIESSSDDEWGKITINVRAK